MGRSQETFGKKEKEKARIKKRKEKEEKMEERKANATKGKSLDDMLAYIDENGNLSATPPDPKKMRVIDHETIQLGAAPIVASTEDVVRTGVITSFFESKGFGFIKDAKNGDSVFVHINNISEPVREGDKVSFELEQTPKGQSAKGVKKI
jgi:cold shock CspA family protein